MPFFGLWHGRTGANDFPPSPFAAIWRQAEGRLQALALVPQDILNFESFLSPSGAW